MATAGEIIKQARLDAGNDATKFYKQVASESQKDYNAGTSRSTAVYTQKNSNSSKTSTSTKQESQVIKEKNLKLGKITNVTHTFPNGELSVNVTILNNSDSQQEYKVFLYGANGKLWDTEPDTLSFDSWKNVTSGLSTIINVNSIGTYGEAKNFGGSYRVVVMAQGNVFIDDKIVSLTTGEVSETGENSTGDLINDTSIGEAIQQGSENSGTPIYTGETSSSGFSFGNMFASGNTTNVMLLIAIGVGAYLIGRK